MRLNSTISGIYMQYALNQNTLGYQKSIEQLSSGCKFSSAGEDPSGIAQVTKIDKNYNVNSRALSNVALGQDILSMAEGYQETINSNLIRIRNLCTQASNGTYSAQDKDAMINEIKLRLSYINEMATNTEYNNIKLLDGSASDFPIQSGGTSSSSINIGTVLKDVRTAALDIDFDPTKNGANWTHDDIALYSGKIDAASKTIIKNSSEIGGFQNRLDFISDNLTSINLNLKEDRSSIADTDVAAASADLIKYQILQQSSATLLTQSNMVPEMVLNLLNTSS